MEQVELLRVLEMSCVDHLGSSPLESPVWKLCRNIANWGCGPELLLKFRRLSHSRKEFPHLDGILKEQLGLLFSGGSLHFVDIQPDDASLTLLKNIVSGDKVHPMTSLDQLASRLSEQRRMFALVHPSAMHDPLYVLQVTLRDDMPPTIDDILADQDASSRPSAPSLAILYAILSLEPALAGLDLGSTLIKMAVHHLQTTAHIHNFFTLSPIPRLRSSLQQAVTNPAPKGHVHAHAHLPAGVEEHWIAALPPGIVHGIQTHLEGTPLQSEESEEADDEAEGRGGGGGALTARGLDRFMEEADLSQPQVAALTRQVVQTYLQQPRLDPVANFHMRNGAAAYRILLKADDKPLRLQQSYGHMVSYHYDLTRLTARRAAFLAAPPQVCTAWSD